MSFIVPLTNDGSRKATYNLGGKDYIIETYYLPKTKTWLMDIYDINEIPILTGITLIPGVDNLVKGLCLETAKAFKFKQQTVETTTPPKVWEQPHF